MLSQTLCNQSVGVGLTLKGGGGAVLGICAVSVAGYIQQMVVARQSGCLFEVPGVGCSLRVPCCRPESTHVCGKARVLALGQAVPHQHSSVQNYRVSIHILCVCPGYIVGVRAWSCLKCLIHSSMCVLSMPLYLVHAFFWCTAACQHLSP